MKVKQQPEDFRVDELTAVIPASDAPFALYRLEKRGWTTHDAVQAIRRRWHIQPNRISFGGLKDKHARTTQHLTIVDGPHRDLQHHQIDLRYLGQVGEPFSSKLITGNRFGITLRDFEAIPLNEALAALDDVRRDGLANYFDDQRFGSVSPDGRFLARELILGNVEDALRLALTASYEHDRGPARQEKATIRRYWGKWAECRSRLKPGPARALIEHLVRYPTDFQGAVERLRPDVRTLYLAAYQSHVWNRLLARWLTEHLPPENRVRVRFRLTDLPMSRRLNDSQRAELAALTLPLPTARTPLPPDDPLRPLADAVLADEGLTWEEFKLKKIKSMFFSRGDRPALLRPADLRSETAADELHPGRKKLVLSFELPPGAYATLIVKRITARTADGRQG